MRIHVHIQLYALEKDHDFTHIYSNTIRLDTDSQSKLYRVSYYAHRTYPILYKMDKKPDWNVFLNMVIRFYIIIGWH